MQIDASLDILALAIKVERDSESGELTIELLRNGNMLFGNNTQNSNLLQKILPNGKVSYRHLKESTFHPHFCPLNGVN